ncbi:MULTISPECIES: DNA-processing protein DprA [unclassified Microbacterium]|uniref:DNA-processing protein DprA n=1 Tax=unclassified Microbacterium TaxID=2609290 RepID=UPI003415C7B5
MIDGLRRDEGLVSAVTSLLCTDPRVDVDRRMDAIARVAWSVLAEPGDGVAGALIQELGATEALRLAVDEHPTPARVRGAIPVEDGAIDEGISRWRPRVDPRRVTDAVGSALAANARLLLPGDPGWPVQIDDLGRHAPLLLWVRGETRLLAAAPQVAIIGARAATAYGEHIAGEFAGELAATGTVIVSGGAYGIDGAAHRAALGVGGATVAFLAGGVDRAYPQGHRDLLERVRTTGAVVSEVPCGTAPTKWRFLSRNRLIAAVSDATVVIEAGWRSGSLNTAGHAASLGRPLGAVPGPVTSATSEGCHRLFREYDARCVTTSAEIRELWGEDPGRRESECTDPDETRLRDAMSSRTPLAASELARRSGLSIERVSALLGFLELRGEARRSERGWIGVRR